MDFKRGRRLVKRRREKLSVNLIIVLLTFFLGIVFIGIQTYIPVHAKELGPLIQTTSFQSDYEGMVHLNLMETRLLEEGDCWKASENVADTFVGIRMGERYGSGNIFDFTENEIIIISNRHVLQYWDGDSYVIFMDGTVGNGEILYLSDERDVGFIRIVVENFGYDELIRMRSVRKEQVYYDNAQANSAFFVLDITSDIYNPIMHEGTILDKNCYINDFETNMIYTRSYGKPGMSGSGMFDACGAYIGMLTAGTAENELVGISLPDILKEYELALTK